MLSTQLTISKMNLSAQSIAFNDSFCVHVEYAIDYFQNKLECTINHFQHDKTKKKIEKIQ